MRKVYAVSSGSYSDYSIDAIFSSRKLAQEYIDTVKNWGGYNDIEEYELDPLTADKIKRGYSVWNVLMLKDGTVERVDRSENDRYDVNNTGHQIWERTKAPAYQGKNIPDVLTSSVWAKTEKQAIKIVNEQRTQMIANGEWK